MEATKPTVWEFPVMQEHVHSWSEYINQCHSDWFRHKTPSNFLHVEGDAFA